jgi:hypothetical protein
MEKRKLKLVANGIGMSLMSVVLAAGATLAMFTPAVAAQSGLVPATIIGVLSKLILPCILTSLVLSILGPTLCIGVPAETRASEWAFAALVCNGLSLVGTIAGRFVSFPVWVGIASGLVLLLGQVLFAVFIRKLAIFLKRDDVALMIIHAIVAVVVGVAALGFGTSQTAFRFVFPTPGLTSAFAQIAFAVIGLLAIVFATMRDLRAMIYMRRELLLKTADPRPV